MKNKKTNQANLEKKRIYFLYVGFIIILTCVLTAFEWSFQGVTDSHLGELVSVVELEEDMINTYQKEKPKEQQKQEVQKAVEIKVVDNSKLVTDIINLISEVDLEKELSSITVELEPEELEDETIYLNGLIDKNPEFDGDVIKWVAKNVVYHDLARKNDISGTVIVQFVIDKRGVVIDAQITRSVHPLLDNAVLEVVKKMPRWKPGQKDGKLVKVAFSMPVFFKLVN